MPSLPGGRTRIFGAGLFVSGLTIGVALASWASVHTQEDVCRGATLASVLPESVMSLTYVSPTGITTMQRAVPDAPFHILSTFSDGKPVQRCDMPAAIVERLKDLTTLTARRNLSSQQRASEFPVQLGVVEVRDTILAEPSGPVLIFANKERTAIAAMFDGRAAEVTLQASELAWLETACTSRL